MISGSLGIGVLGYRFVADLEWIDALLNASMILTGMGPVTVLQTSGAKVFASAYALFSGVVFLASMSFVIAPIAHRVLHRLHIEAGRQGARDDDAKDGENGSPARKRRKPPNPSRSS